jgi:hypothetical protein
MSVLWPLVAWPVHSFGDHIAKRPAGDRVTVGLCTEVHGQFLLVDSPGRVCTPDRPRVSL